MIKEGLPYFIKNATVTFYNSTEAGFSWIHWNRIHCLPRSKTLHNKVSCPVDKESCSVGILRRNNTGSNGTDLWKIELSSLATFFQYMKINEHCQIQWIASFLHFTKKGEMWGLTLCKNWGVCFTLCKILFSLSWSLLHVNIFLAAIKASDHTSAFNSTSKSFSHCSLALSASTDLQEINFPYKREMNFFTLN